MAGQGAENHNPSNDSVSGTARVPMACPKCGKTSISYPRLVATLRSWRLECAHCRAPLRLERLFSKATIIAGICGLALVLIAVALKETGVLDKSGFVAFILVGLFIVPWPFDYLAWRYNWVRYVVDNSVACKPTDELEEGHSAASKDDC